MEINNNQFSSISETMLTQDPNDPSSAWTELAHAAGAIRNLLNEINKQMNSSHPNLDTISDDLTQIQGYISQMIEIAQKNHLQPIGDPGLISQMQTFSDQIGEVRQAVADGVDSKGENLTQALHALAVDFAPVFQGILQG